MEAKTFNEIVNPHAKTFSEVAKFNPYHGPDGRFTTAGAASSFTITTRGKLAQGAADKAIEREKQKEAAQASAKSDKKRTAAIKKVEDKIRQQNYESAAIIDSNGKQLLFKDGESSSVHFTGEECRMMRGMTVTHNHPSSSHFSNEDVSVFVYTGMQEMRAAGKNGVTHILRRTKGNTMGDSATEKETEFSEKFVKQFTEQKADAKAKAYKYIEESGDDARCKAGEIPVRELQRIFNDRLKTELDRNLNSYANKYGFEYERKVES